jgi:TonB family C-terminal domain
MKKIIFSLIISWAAFTSCINGNHKQERLPAAITPEDTGINNPKPENTESIENDTIVFTAPDQTAATPWKDGVKEYFRKHNRYKDWDKNDKKKTLVGFATLKDGSNINVTIKRSSGNSQLDEEAVRLVKEMKYDEPATDFNRQPVNIDNMVIFIVFPPD